MVQRPQALHRPGPQDRHRRGAGRATRTGTDARGCVTCRGVTLDELKKAVADGTVDTVLLAIADMEGRLQGKRLTAPALPRRRARARRRGLQLPARRRRRHGDGRRLRDVLVGARLRRLRDGPRPRHAAAGPLARGHGDGARRPAVGRRPRGGRLAAPDPAPPARPAGRARAGRQRRAPSSSSSSSGTPTRRPGSKAYRDLEPANLYNIDYSLLGLGAGRAADPPDPQRDGRRRDDGRELEGRVQPRPARDQLPLRRGARGRRRPRRSTRTAPRRSPPRRRWRSPSWPSSTRREGNSCHIHCSLAREDGGNAFAADRQLFERFVAGQLACMRELTLLYAPHVNSYKRFAAGLVRARPRSPGATTTAPARCGSSATARGCGSRTGCRAPTSIPTWR